MCTDGANAIQFEQMIGLIDDHVALEYRWVHKLAHSAGDAGYETVYEKLHAAQALLGDVRAALDEAKAALELDAQVASADSITAHLV